MKPRILALTAEPPRVPGSGGEVRTYHFTKMLAGYGSLTLVSLGGPSGESTVASDIAEQCYEVIEPGVAWRGNRSEKPTRLHSWLRLLSVFAMPWRNNWKQFYLYCIQYLNSGSNSTGATLDWRKKWIQTILKFEYRWCARFFNLPPRSVFTYLDKYEAIRGRVESAVSVARFDLVWYEHTHMFPIIQEMIDASFQSGGFRLVCNAHNIEWLLNSRMADFASSKWESEDSRLQSKIIRKAEKDQFQLTNLIFVCSEEDRVATMQLVPEAKVSVIGNGVDTEYFHPPDTDNRSAAPTLLYTGTFGYAPNVDAVKFFLREIFPLIRVAIPDCRFVFAGRGAQAAYEGLGLDDDQVACISSPDDIRPCFNSAWAFVAPIRSGGGTRLKLLEAMSMEVPVVATSLAAEGIPVVSGQQLLLADSPAEFANSVVELLNCPDRQADLRCNASYWVREHYDWKPLVSQAEKYLDGLLQ